MNKMKNSKLNDESRLTFNYSKVKKEMFKSYLKLSLKIHDYLTNSRH